MIGSDFRRSRLSQGTTGQKNILAQGRIRTSQSLIPNMQRQQKSKICTGIHGIGIQNCYLHLPSAVPQANLEAC